MADHDRDHDDLVSYLLDELSVGERGAFETHLAGCTECAAEDVLGPRPTIESAPRSTLPASPERVRAPVHGEAGRSPRIWTHLTSSAEGSPC